MSDWDQYSTGFQREFLISVELYVSNTAGTSLRKPVSTPRKKSDNRISIKTQSTSTEDKKVREKSSWLALARGPSGTGHWRPATCKLTEEGERCLLNIYVDESILYQTLYIHLLNHTDIRQADISLFFRKHCLGIYCASPSGQRWNSNNTAEPVYLQFPNADTSNTWLTLLRSYAIPEIYGRLFFPVDGGSYRMWRQVELSVIQGRNLGSTKGFDSIGSQGTDSIGEVDGSDIDVSCEINLNGTLCARTTTKKGISSPEWHENFLFADLPPFDNLDVIVWREKKLFKPTMLGTVRIALTNFRRGEAMDGWFPLVQSGPIASDVRVGELRLKVKVDEEIILPYSAYSGLLSTFNSRNFLEWTAEFESKLKLKNISSQLLSVALANDQLIDHIHELAAREVDGTPSSHQTLFRGNTILTKVMELTMNLYGKPFLEASIGTVLRRLCNEKVAIEIDPIRSGKGTRDVERNVDQLKYWVQAFWEQIYSVRAECPYEMRRLFEILRKLVERRYQRHELDDNRELPWQSVSAFIFLRFIVPAILHPHLFGLCPGLPALPVQRSLTLIAKAVQSLANLNATVQKEDFMREVNNFLKDARPAMIDYLLIVSTPSKDGYGPLSDIADRHERLSIVHSLRERAKAKPVLDREAVPMLPHLLDIPRHLAIITSAVIRSSRDYLASEKARDPEDAQVQEFCAKCYQVEELALQRVSQLAARISASNNRSGGANGISKTKSRTPRRPSTAPSSSDTDRSKRKITFNPRTYARDTSFNPNTSPVPSTSTVQIIPSPPRHPSPKTKLLHLKSPSTDAITSPRRSDASVETMEDPAKKRKGLFKNIWSKR